MKRFLSAFMALVFTFSAAQMCFASSNEAASTAATSIADEIIPITPKYTHINLMTLSIKRTSPFKVRMIGRLIGMDHVNRVIIRLRLQKATGGGGYDTVDDQQKTFYDSEGEFVATASVSLFGEYRVMGTFIAYSKDGSYEMKYIYAYE